MQCGLHFWFVFKCHVSELFMENLSQYSCEYKNQLNCQKALINSYILLLIKARMKKKINYTQKYMYDLLCCQ